MLHKLQQSTWRQGAGCRNAQTPAKPPCRALVLMSSAKILKQKSWWSRLVAASTAGESAYSVDGPAIKAPRAATSSTAMPTEVRHIPSEAVRKLWAGAEAVCFDGARTSIARPQWGGLYACTPSVVPCMLAHRCLPRPFPCCP